ncbi:Crp/Fnr family transcriptional regulator [Cytophaga sp. FL35]|uniref:Crp/Fnr family transcriptional regulator n=1 Tax=Cytophaga sp. FL35 TaxID=1904456 RepID=UPI001653DA09|nr:Crp/Fnr family transcriptional regulator [Cytophaga sp. FL35]MBC6998113.1 Crp/Fnr family transcriptional regulator [Cytophaga sp. FL35]
MKEKLQQFYGYLFEEELFKEIGKVGLQKSIPQGAVIMDIGQNITHMPLLLEGAIKILREDEDGDELLLYFLERGDTCAMTLSCCMGTHKSEIRAIAESDTELLMIPVQQMELWMAKYQSWRQFILDSYHTRMMELLETVDTLAFLRMDERLLKHLRDKAKVNQNESIHTTHQEIAYDLNTSRVVISRLLKKLEKEGKIKMHRHEITVVDL